uniref:RNA polymerase sigma factor n=1 Tax=uncultured Draconibacterium sp. TaxID=1573823 RepID=UPI0032167E9F
MAYKETDKFLWAQVREGNHDALAKLFKTYYAGLFAYGLKINSSPDFVRDQIQELFLTLWQSHNKLSEASNVKAYLLVSLRRSMLVSRKTRCSEEISYNTNSDFLVFEPNEFIDKQEISSKVKSRLLKNINTLPEKQREVVFLRFYHGLGYREISEVVDVKEQSVKNMMPKIFNKLREGLTDIKRDDLSDLDVLLFEFFMLFLKKS